MKFPVTSGRDIKNYSKGGKVWQTHLFHYKQLTVLK